MLLRHYAPQICLMRLWALVTVAWLHGVCCAHLHAQSNEQPRDVDASETKALASKVKEIFRARCFECHGGSAVQADLNILDKANLVKNEMVIAGQPDKSPLIQSITASNDAVRMPQDLPALAASDIDLVRQWILADLPDFPTDVSQPTETAKEQEFEAVAGVEYVLKEILAHQRTLAPDKRRNVRYFSCNHLLAGGATRDELDVQYAAFAKVINHLSRESKIVRPDVINGNTATIFAVDLRDIGWHRRPFKIIGATTTVSQLNLHDLVLLEYPYGILYEDSATFDALSTEYLGPAAQVRPLPYVRTDWFCSIATLPPLYHDLLQLPRDLGTLERELGIEVEDNLKHRKGKRAGMTVSGVSRNNRAVERHPSSNGSYWKSIDYASSKGTENIFTDPVNLHGTGGEMIFSLPNGLQAYFVCDGTGKRLNEAPTSIVTDKFAEDKTVRNGLSCIRCHDQGIKDFRDDVRPAIENISGSGQINKRETLALYPAHDDMEMLIDEDQTRFVAAMKKIMKVDQRDEPLAPVSKRFLDTPLQLRTVAGELGLTAVDDLKATFRQPNFTAFGLVALANAGVIRRDMWEDYFDDVVRSLGLGIPILPIDSLTTLDHLPDSNKSKLQISTSKKNNVFAPGDELRITVSNSGTVPLFIELFGTSAAGETVALIPAGTKLEAGKQLHFPATGSIKVRPVLGKELITLFASENEFAAGQILRAENIADRVVHDFYKLELTDSGAQPRRDAKSILRRTLEIETR